MNKIATTAIVFALAHVSALGLAQAEDTAPAPPAPSIVPGGHVGLALPLFTIGNAVGNEVTGIGADFFTIGLSTGFTMKFDEHWMIDFEAIAYNEFKNAALSTFLLDPGVLYNFGPVTAGARVATKVGGGQAANVGIVPIIVVPFKVSNKISYYVEGDLPIFFSDNHPVGKTGIQPSIGLQLQTGIAF